MTSDESRTAEQLRALAETTSDALVTIDTDSRIQFVNPAIEDILGYAPAELLGESLTVLMSDRLAECHTDAVERYLETGTRRVDWDGVELTGRHSDGHDVPLEISFGEFSLDGDRYFTGVLRDISERKAREAERNLREAVRDRIVGADSFDDGLAKVLELIGDSMGWACGEAWVSTDDGDGVRLETAWHADGDDADRTRSKGTVVEPDDGLVGRVWTTGEYEWIPDVSAVDDPPFPRTGVRAALAVPIRTDGTVVAVMVFLRSESQSTDDHTIEVTRIIAANLGLLVARKRAEDALREERDLLSNILQTTPTGIVVLDDDWEISFANDRAESIFRLEPDADGNYPPVGELPVDVLDVDGDDLPESANPYHTVFDTGESVSRDLGVSFPDGDRRWLTVHGTPLRDETGAVRKAVFAVEDVTDLRRQATQLERLNELGQALSGTETFEAACERTVDAAREILDLPVTTIERYDADAGRLVSVCCTPRVDELFDDGPLFDGEHDLSWQTFVENRPHVHADLVAESAVDAEETPLRSAIVLPLGEHGVFVSGATEPDAFSETDLKLARILAANAKSVFDRLDREAALRDRTEELETERERLRRVQRVNCEIRDITQALLDATSQEEIKAVVCDRLASGGGYRFAWFGERDLATEEFVATASAGVEEGYLDAVTITADGSATGQGPAGRAIRTREPQIQNNLQSDPPFEPWQQEALQRGYRASISVPVAYNDTLYGLLNLYADRPEVFGEMEATVLAELGEMIGYALNAMERYDALVSEKSTELEFVIHEASVPLFSLLREHEGSVRLETIGHRDDGTVRAFVAVQGLDRETIRSFADRQFDSDVTFVRDRDGETIVELSLPRDSFPVVLVERGAMPFDIRATATEGRITIRIPTTASVREFVEMFERRYDDVELVARRESGESVQTNAEFERAYVDRLTDRQQEVLQTAYFAGFFEQPRDNTARDVAEMLDVSQPTVSRHLRRSQRKLFEMLFDDE